MEDPHPSLKCVLDRFPERAAVLRLLLRSDLRFRSICEDYALACAGLAAFEARPDATSRPEVAEYRLLLAELETEITNTLRELGMH